MAMRPQIRIGCGEVVITPPVGSYLAGFAARTEAAAGIHDDLYARAVAADDGTHRVALIACDLCSVDDACAGEIRQRVRARTGLSEDAIMVAATHTHAAPATIALYSAPPDPAWRRELPALAAEAAARAMADLAPAAVAVAVGHEASVGRNRRRDGGVTDPRVTVLRADRIGKRPVLVLHYACHPTVLGPDNLLISRDYVGFALDALEQGTGGWAMFLNGACGDVNAGHSADRSALGLPIEGRTFARAETLGTRLGEAAVRALSGPQPVVGTVGAARKAFAVPLRDTPAPDAMATQVREWKARVAGLEGDMADQEVLTGARLELLYAELGLLWSQQRGGETEVPTEVQAIGIGDLAWIALPGEFFAESGLRLRAASPFGHTCPVGYANGGLGYVPPASAFAEGGYETRLAPWSKVAPEAEASIVAEAAGVLAALKPET